MLSLVDQGLRGTLKEYIAQKRKHSLQLDHSSFINELDLFDIFLGVFVEFIEYAVCKVNCELESSQFVQTFKNLWIKLA